MLFSEESRVRRKLEKGKVMDENNDLKRMPSKNAHVRHREKVGQRINQRLDELNRKFKEQIDDMMDRFRKDIRQIKDNYNIQKMESQMEEIESVVKVNELEFEEEKTEVSEMTIVENTILAPIVEEKFNSEELEYELQCGIVEIEDTQTPKIVDNEEILEEILEKKECKDFLLGEAKEDVMGLNSCSSFVESSLQVHDKENTGLLDSTHAAPILPWDDILPIGNGEKPPHNFHDHFSAYVDATLNCYDYISNTPSFINIYMKPRYTFHVTSVKRGSRHQRAIHLKLCI